VFGDADAIGARRVDDQHAPTTGRGDVDVVDASAGASNDPEVGRCREQFFGDLGGAADQQSVGIGQIVGEIGRAPPGSGINVPAFRAEQFERRLWEVVSDDDF